MAFLLSISVGSVYIPINQIFDVLLGQEVPEHLHKIIWDYRLPKVITALLVGAGLGVSGMMMQTFFKNPLAGPYVLGISSGASLGVALVVLGAGLLPFLPINQWSTVMAGSLGSFAVLAIVLLVSQKIESTTTLLIVGLMFGSFSSSLVGILAYFSEAEQLKKFTLWSLGSLNQMSWQGVQILSLFVLMGLLIGYSQIKGLNLMLMGSAYAKSLGLQLNKFKFLVILSTALIAGSITAFVGPIAFIGLAIPHVVRLWLQTSQQKIIFLGSLIIGALLLILCDTIAQLPGFDLVLPINAITSLVGAPIVIWLVIKRQKLSL